MATNEASISVAGYIATDPVKSSTRSGAATLSMRLAWTPRRLDPSTGQWADETTCFATVKCYRRLAENAGMCLHKGEPVLVSGTMRLREYEAKDGTRRMNIDINANSIGHDLSRGAASFRRFHGPAGRIADQPEGGENATVEAQDPEEARFAEIEEAGEDYGAEELGDGDSLSTGTGDGEPELATTSS